MNSADILNRLKENNYFIEEDNSKQPKENVKKKLDFMLEVIDVVIKDVEKQMVHWKQINDKFKPGCYNKAISELCLSNIKSSLESAKSAKKYLFNCN